jgi:hypothetical protein
MTLTSRAKNIYVKGGGVMSKVKIEHVERAALSRKYSPAVSSALASQRLISTVPLYASFTCFR